VSNFDKWWIAERDLTPHDRYIMWGRQQADIERLNARFKVLQAVFTGADVGTSDGIGSRIIYTPEIQVAIWGVKR
jgi:hypothetical protein